MIVVTTLTVPTFFAYTGSYNVLLNLEKTDVLGMGTAQKNTQRYTALIIPIIQPI